MCPVFVKNTASHRPEDKKTTTMDWIYDKHRAESPARTRDIVDTRRGDYYDGPGKKRVFLTDSYKPGNGNIGNHRKERWDSYRPLPKDSPEPSRNGRYGIHKATACYRSVLGDIVDKAFAAGIAAESFCGAYYQCGRKVKREKPMASAYWLLWKQECMIWKHFCMRFVLFTHSLLIC
jgi:hypothetical protein